MVAHKIFAFLVDLHIFCPAAFNPKMVFQVRKEEFQRPGTRLMIKLMIMEVSKNVRFHVLRTNHIWARLNQKVSKYTPKLERSNTLTLNNQSLLVPSLVSTSG